jgi:hypothetical protein
LRVGEVNFEIRDFGFEFIDPPPLAGGIPGISRGDSENF